VSAEQKKEEDFWAGASTLQDYVRRVWLHEKKPPADLFLHSKFIRSLVPIYGAEKIAGIVAELARGEK
jgi:hypothetical protein